MQVTTTQVTQAAVITVRLAWFLLETGHDVRLEFTQRGRLQRLKVDLDLVGVRVFECRFTGLNDQHDTTELVTCTCQTNVKINTQNT